MQNIISTTYTMFGFAVFRFLEKIWANALSELNVRHGGAGIAKEDCGWLDVILAEEMKQGGVCLLLCKIALSIQRRKNELVRTPWMKTLDEVLN
jgi:hypothetical protein